MKLNATPLGAFGSTVTFADLVHAGGEPLLARGPDGRVQLRHARGHTPVTVHCCVPWSAPGRFISLRGPDRAEVALIEDPSALDEQSRAVLEDALATAGFAFEVLRILDVEDEIEIRRWRVETRQGERAFQTPRDRWPRELDTGGYLIRDVAGDLYHIPEASHLDPRSRRLLWTYAE